MTGKEGTTLWYKMTSQSNLDDSGVLDVSNLSRMMSHILIGEDDDDPEVIEKLQPPTTELTLGAISPPQREDKEYNAKNDITFAKSTSELCSSPLPPDNQPTCVFSDTSCTAVTTNSAAATYFGIQTSSGAGKPSLLDNNCLTVGLSDFLAHTNSNNTLCDITSTSLTTTNLASDLTIDPTNKLLSQTQLQEKPNHPQQTSPSSLSSSSQELNSCLGGAGSSVDSAGMIKMH